MVGLCLHSAALWQLRSVAASRPINRPDLAFAACFALPAGGVALVDVRSRAWPVLYANSAFAAAEGGGEDEEGGDSCTSRGFWDLFDPAEAGSQVGRCLADCGVVRPECEGADEDELALVAAQEGSGGGLPFFHISDATGPPGREMARHIMPCTDEPAHLPPFPAAPACRAM